MDVGGAARAALRLQEGLEQRGADSSVLVARKRSRLSSVREWEGPMDWRSRVFRRVRKESLEIGERRRTKSKPKGLDWFSDDRSSFSDQLVPKLHQTDLLHFHWVAGFLDAAAVLPRLDRPAVWTLHDQHAFTGGCHYDTGCQRWRRGCGQCPQLGRPSKRDFSARSWERKRKAYSHVPGGLTLVTPSRWLGKLVAESPLLGDKRVEVIPYGVPTRTFHPGGREGLRRAFGLGERDRALLFVADRISNRRKGFAVLQESLAGLPAPAGGRLVLFSVGRKSPERLGNHELITLGSIENEELMAAVYSAADLFVAPSLQDNLPNTVLESLACETPVIGSHTGGIPDMVRPGETGWLFETGNPEALRATLQEALATRDLTGLRTRCREVAEREYSLELQAERYSKLYFELLRQGRESTI